MKNNKIAVFSVLATLISAGFSSTAMALTHEEIILNGMKIIIIEGAAYEAGADDVNDEPKKPTNRDVEYRHHGDYPTHPFEQING